MSSDEEPKRREARVTINKDFESVDEFIREYVTNISKTGAFVKRADPLPVGTEVDLKFTVIMDDVETVEGVGKVVRVQHDPPGMGVVFTQVSQYSRHLLEQLLTPQRSGPGPSGRQS
jgi:uncharacterized protein (TIGR02266 family)